MTQGNFYEILHFCMDSCAISPTASLLSVTTLRESATQIPKACNFSDSGASYPVIYTYSQHVVHFSPSSRDIEESRRERASKPVF